MSSEHEERTSDGVEPEESGDEGPSAPEEPRPDAFSREHEAELARRLEPSLREIARALMRGQPAHHTLQVTALLSEFWARGLLGVRAGSDWTLGDERQFLRAAAKVMRNILIEHARRKSAERRKARTEDVDVDTVSGPSPSRERVELAVDLGDAFEKLRANQPDAYDVAIYRDLLGRDVAETAELLGVSKRTVYTRQELGRAFLRRALGRSDGAH